MALSEKQTIPEIIEELKRIEELELQNAKYSTDTASRLYYLSEEIKRHAREVFQCCY